MHRCFKSLAFLVLLFTTPGSDATAQTDSPKNPVDGLTTSALVPKSDAVEVCQCAKAGAAPKYARSVAKYQAPDVTFQDQNGRRVSLASQLDHEGPVMLQFFFTSCSTLCPVLSGSFSSVRPKLGDDLPKVKMISISIDPQHDTPARLKEYAELFEAQPQWQFFTGRAADIQAVQKAFDAFQTNKMQHHPLTFIRPQRGADWIRLDGLLSAEQLAQEYFAAMK